MNDQDATAAAPVFCSDNVVLKAPCPLRIHHVCDMTRRPVGRDAVVAVAWLDFRFSGAYRRCVRPKPFTVLSQPPYDWNMIDRIALWQNLRAVSPRSSAFCFPVA